MKEILHGVGREVDRKAKQQIICLRGKENEGSYSLFIQSLQAN